MEINEKTTQEKIIRSFEILNEEIVSLKENAINNVKKVDGETMFGDLECLQRTMELVCNKVVDGISVLTLQELTQKRNKLNRDIKKLKKAEAEQENEAMLKEEEYERDSYHKQGMEETRCTSCYTTQWMKTNKLDGVCCECGAGFENENYEEENNCVNCGKVITEEEFPFCSDECQYEAHKEIIPKGQDEEYYCTDNRLTHE
jgi:hypothetical protein